MKSKKNLPRNENLNNSKIIRIKNGERYEKNGWTYISVKGTSKECGYANGYLLSAEMQEIFRMLDFNIMNNFGYTRDFLSDVIGESFKPQIKNNYPEIYEELEGIVDGANQGVKDNKHKHKHHQAKHFNLNDIILWNCNTSIDYMMGSLPSLVHNNVKLNAKYGHMFSNEAAGSASGQHHGEGGGGGGKKNGSFGQRGPGADRCTAFIAVGSYTKDGKIVCAHNSFDNFLDGQYFNIMLDIQPKKGYRMLMQAAPGSISSGTDFYVTSGGLICTETTIGGFNKFILKDPICCRIRQAMQFENTLDGCVRALKYNNSGDYANSWLIGDTNTNTIMRIELGLEYVNVEKKTDGYFIGFNAADDPRIRNLECENNGYYDIRRHQGARRVRLTELMEEYKGKIDVAIGEQVMADHYDVYLKKENPSSRTCCGHYELDDRAFMSQADRPKPYQPRGALDGVVSDTAMAKRMALSARWGSSCGKAFDKTAFCKEHIQWNDQEPYLRDRPSEPWTEFTVSNNIIKQITGKMTRKK